MKSVILSVPALALLAACGGGSTGSTSIEALWTAPPPSSAGVVRATSTDKTGVVLVPDVNNAGRYQSAELVQIISETTYPDGSVYGEAVVRWPNGTTSNIVAVIYDNAELYVNAREDTGVIVASGTPVSNMPIGNYTYSGYAFSAYEYNGREYGEDGNFTMAVQFSSRTAQLLADTAESRYSNQNLSITSNGEIAGHNGIFIIYDVDGSTELERRNMSFNGTFHGAGATAVSGLAVGVSPSGDAAIVGIVGDR